MNPQEQFWAGEFGDAYTKRNRVRWEDRVPLWREVLDLTKATSVLDVGCNAGWNMRAIRVADPSVRLVGIDVNADAVAEARTEELDARVLSLADMTDELDTFDLVATSGVLIHVAPEHLQAAMRNIVRCSRRWVLAIEYEAEQEEAIVYRGNSDRLWKRPFGKLYEELGLRLVANHGAPGYDKCSKWLMEKI